MFAGVTYYNQLKQKANTWNISRYAVEQDTRSRRHKSR